MTRPCLTDIEVKQVVALLKTACIVVGIAILCRQLSMAESEDERLVLAQTLLRIIGLESEQGQNLSQFRYEQDEADDDWPRKPGYAFR